MNLLLEELNGKYLDKVIKNEENKKMFEELETLRENECVKRYLELVKLERKIFVYDDDYLLNMTFNKKRECELFDCNIYVYYGAYVDINSNIYLDGKITHDVINSDYMLYKNLLVFSDFFKVTYEEQSYSDDKVIIVFNDNNFCNRDDYDKAYNKLRAFYCRLLLKGKMKDEILEEIDNNKQLFGIDIISYNVQSDVVVKRRELSLK